MTQNLNLLFLFWSIWSVSLATITRRLVEMDRMRKLYIYLTQSDFTWQPRNVLDMQALQRVQLGPGVFKHVAVCSDVCEESPSRPAGWFGTCSVMMNISNEKWLPTTMHRWFDLHLWLLETTKHWDSTQHVDVTIRNVDITANTCSFSPPNWLKLGVHGWLKQSLIFELPTALVSAPPEAMWRLPLKRLAPRCRPRPSLCLGFPGFQQKVEPPGSKPPKVSWKFLASLKKNGYKLLIYHDKPRKQQGDTISKTHVDAAYSWMV